MKLEVGRAYRLNLRGGVEVDIVGKGLNSSEDYNLANGDSYTGDFFVGITRNDPGFNNNPGDWLGAYAPDGTRLWEDDNTFITESGKAAYNLVEAA